MYSYRAEDVTQWLRVLSWSGVLFLAPTVDSSQLAVTPTLGTPQSPLASISALHGLLLECGTAIYTQVCTHTTKINK